MPLIDLHGVLQRTVSAGYGDLVTRRTGQAVRYGVEEHLAGYELSDVAVIDFSGVRCLDYSCADEVVGKLLLAHREVRYFTLRGVSPMQREAIESVLERYGIAVVAEDRTGQTHILGPVSDAVREAFSVVAHDGATDAHQIAGSMDVTAVIGQALLEELLRHRLAVAGTANRIRPLG